MTPQEIESLLYRYTQGLCSDKEREIIDQWFDDRESFRIIDLSADELDLIGSRLRNNVLDSTSKPTRTKRIYHWAIYSLLAAACVLLFFFLPDFKTRPVPTIHPAKVMASLQFANGQLINLEETTVDRELNLNGLKIHRSADGRAIYQLIDQGIDGYNTLKVPKGGRFKVLLPDSTVVWLNSESELRYPCNFLASDRKVSLSGEAYFEVFKNRRNSFTVSTSWAEVKVLGTGFNVRAYQDDQEMETFVSHGTVMVSTDQDEKILHKNDRIHVNREGQIKSLQSIQANSPGWNEGVFYFNKTPLHEIAKQISRWYNIEVVLDQEVRDLEFYGIIPKTDTANQLLEILEATNLIKVTILDDKILLKKANQ